MKRNNLFKYIFGNILVCALALGFVACDDSNDWDVDGGANQMFSPVTFETSAVEATSVTLRLSTVPYDKSYVFEFSEDSLEFNSIVKTVEIPKADLEADPNASGKKYLVTIPSLDASMQYSVRVKVTSTTGIPDSKYVAVAFKTRGEQILNVASNITNNSALITWAAGSEVTDLIYTWSGGSETVNLTSTMIAEGKYEMTNLEEETVYSVQIKKGDRVRGSVSFATFPGSVGEGVIYSLDGTEDLNDYLANVVVDERVVLMVPAGSTYTVGGEGKLVVPASIKSLTLQGLPDGDQPVLICKEISLDASAATFNFIMFNIDYQGTSSSADYLMNDNPSSGRAITEFQLRMCKVSNVRGVFRMRGSLSVSKITIDDCQITNIGSFGVINADAETVTVGSIEFKNSTVADGVTSGSLFTFKVKPASLVVNQSTFYNPILTTGRYFATFTSAANVPSAFSVSNSIFSGSEANAAIQMRMTNPKIESQFVYNSYKTSEVNIPTGYPATGIEDYNGASTNLFVDPANGDFTINDITIGQGSKPGDPRWWAGVN